MNENKKQWLKAADVNGWEMPPSKWWWRLPIMRHVKSIVSRMEVERHNELVRHMGMIPTGYDEWVVYGIWIGAKR